MNESKSELECKANVYSCLKFDLFQMMMPCSSHAQTTQTLSKMDEIGLFWNFRSRGTTLMLNIFPFETCIMVNFEVEVWKFQHVKVFSKCQAICSIIPPWLTFHVSSK